MKFILSEETRLKLEDRAESSATSGEQHLGSIRLYNKNDFSTFYVKIVDKCMNKCAWIVETDEEVPRYFTHVLRPLDNLPTSMI